MIRKMHSTFLSADGITNIHVVTYLPNPKYCLFPEGMEETDGVPRAILQIAHGMTEHIERYDTFAKYMANRGILVVGHDMLGHGMSVEEPEDMDLYGYFTPNDPNRVLLEDIYQLMQDMKKRYPSVPYVLMGHSFGSFLARQFMFDYPGMADGVIVMGTGMPGRIPVRFMKILLGILGRVQGERHHSKLVTRMIFGPYEKAFPEDKTGFGWLTKEDDIVNAYVADPRCGFVFTVNGYKAMFEGIGRLQKKHNLKMMQKELPVLIISGEDDPVGNKGRAPKKIARSFRKLGMEHVTLRLFLGDRHEVLSEADRELVFYYLYRWMKREHLVSVLPSQEN
ncbi:MAG: alpha/beta fold hydrolase [Lachnospiraceae bacterium]|nr:alpha/beta fold hydrolase [Lachnospiraceae bacterium]